MASSSVSPRDSVSNVESGDDITPYRSFDADAVRVASVIANSLGEMPRAITGLPELAASLRDSESRDSILSDYINYHSDLLSSYTKSIELISNLTVSGGVSTSAPASPVARSSRKPSGFPGYELPLDYDEMKVLYKRVGVTPFFSGFDASRDRYKKGVLQGTSFSVHQFGSRGSSMASSNYGTFPLGKCYLQLIVGGHKAAARELFGDNPDFTALLSAPAHMFSVSAMLTVRVTRVDLHSWHAGEKGTYPAVALFARFIQCHSFQYVLPSSRWDGTLLQALVTRSDYADSALLCTETLPYKTLLGATLPSDDLGLFDLDPAQRAAMVSLCDVLFPSRDWKFVVTVPDGDCSVVVPGFSSPVELVYHSDFSFSALRPVGRSSYWTPLRVSQRPSAELRCLVESLPCDSVPPVSDDLLARSRADFSSCKCAVHSWPASVEWYRRSCAGSVGCRMGPLRAALTGSHHACVVDERTRLGDREFLRLLVTCDDGASYSSKHACSEFRHLASANSTSTRDFGPGYCYLDLVRSKFRYRVARSLGPCPYVVDVMAVCRAVGRVDCVVDLVERDGLFHVQSHSSSSLRGGADAYAMLQGALSSAGPSSRVGAAPFVDPCTVGRRVYRVCDDVPDVPYVFLAGSSERDPGDGWREALIRSGVGSMCGVAVPRNSDLTHLAVPLPVRAAWERKAMDGAGAVVFSFRPASGSTVSMLELGLLAKSSKVHVVCHPGFERRDTVLDLCTVNGLPVHPSEESAFAVASSVAVSRYLEFRHGLKRYNPGDPMPDLPGVVGSEMLAVVSLSATAGDVVCGGMTMRERVRFRVGQTRYLVFSGTPNSECMVPYNARLWYGTYAHYVRATCGSVVAESLMLR